ncbi:MAG: thiol-disulfide oxidoreductase DCC family protein [Dongiaceae bacterium]
METLLRGWDNGRKRRSGRLAMMAIAAAGSLSEQRDAAASAALASITGAGAEGDHVALTVFYNGSCPVCRKHVGRFQKISAGRSRLIAWADSAAAPWALRRWHVDPAEAPMRLYAVTDDGRLLSGAAAFARLWRELPGYRALGTVVGLPGIRQIAEGLYRVIYVRDLRRRMAAEGKLCGGANLSPAP